MKILIRRIGEPEKLPYEVKQNPTDKWYTKKQFNRHLWLKIRGRKEKHESTRPLYNP